MSRYLVLNETKFVLDTRRKGYLEVQDQVLVVPLVHNTYTEDRTKVYSIRALPSYIWEVTSWYLAN
jgi:hypothetical protein